MTIIIAAIIVVVGFAAVATASFYAFTRLADRRSLFDREIAASADFHRHLAEMRTNGGRRPSVTDQPFNDYLSTGYIVTKH